MVVFYRGVRSSETTDSDIKYVTVRIINIILQSKDNYEVTYVLKDKAS